jgi:pSer/pThr/pTyr-binding forkhead associated (FHA) protein
MNEPRRDAEAGDRPVQGPHWHPARTNEPGAAVPRLRLLLRPSGMVVDCTRTDLVIGRHSGADVRLPLPDVSRRHCRLVYADGAWQVIDLDSLNGVFVNGERVRQGVLHQRDQLRLGGFTFDVELGAGEPAVCHPDSAAAADSVLRSIGQALPEPGDGPANPARRAS